MQHGLLALAIALILAIVAALAAPAYVDWNEWRASFEQQASELAGTPVQIRGPIEATILPTPAFVLRDVKIGDPEKSTGIQAGEVRGILSLGALLRGAFEAEEFELVRPAIRIAVESGGRLLLPGGRANAPDTLAISRFAVSGGSLTLDDRVNRSLTFFDGISANGELRSRSGPLRLDANMRLDGRRWNLRVSTGVFGSDGSARTRAALERPDDGVLLDADGFLAFTNGLPRFNGRVNLAHRKAALPWRIAANASMSGDLVTFESMELSAGASETPLELTGHMQFVPRRGGQIEGMLSAKRLDLDRALGVQAGQGLAALLLPLRESVMRAGELPLNGRIGISADLLVANAGTVRDLRGEIGLREGFLGLENIEAKLPGRASIRAASSGATAGYFLGDVTLEAEEPAALVRWAAGAEKAAAIEDNGALRIAGRADWALDRIVVERLDFALGEARLGGGFSIAHPDGERASLKTNLNANGVDLDLLMPLAEALWSGSKASDVALGFQGSALRLFGKPLRRIDVAVSRNAGSVSFERLNLEDFDGLSGKASGRITDPSGKASGKISFEIDAARPGGLAALAKELGGDDFQTIASKLLANGLPLKLSGAASGGDARAGVSIDARGKLADVNAELNLRLDPASHSLNGANVTMEAGEAGKLLALFGISPGPPAPGDGRLTVALEKGKAGAFPLKAQLSVPGAELSAEGEILLAKANRLEPRLELKLDASDLRPALIAATRAGGEGAIAAKGSARLTRSADVLSFGNLALEIGRTRAAGEIGLSAVEKPVLSGRLSLDRIELTDLLALAAGSSGDQKSFWPASRLAAAPLAGVSGAIDMEVAALGLTGAQVATTAKFKLRLGNHEAAFGNFTADYAGGKLSGEGKIARSDVLSFDGHASLVRFDVARLLVPGTWKAEARGRGNLILSLAGNGATPAALAANLSGQGTLSLENLEIDALDPSALAAVMASSEKSLPKDERALLASVNAALAKAPLRLAKLEAPLVAATGTLRTGKAIAKAGEVEVTAEANFDLAKLAVDGAVELEASAEKAAARPGVTVRWRGPVGAPSRSLDVSALATAINLRAMERETRKLEQRERDRSELPPVSVPEPASSARVAREAPLPPVRDEPLSGALKLPRKAPLPPLRIQ